MYFTNCNCIQEEDFETTTISAVNEIQEDVTVQNNLVFDEDQQFYPQNIPTLIGRVTPMRIQNTLHELTTMKGLDGIHFTLIPILFY